MAADPPLCFVLMPFGKKADPVSRAMIDFNAVFERAIRPAIEAAGMSPLRGDLEAGGGIIHKQFFERLMLCDFAVADLTTGNANVFYEFGVRHAIRPRTTVAVTAHPERMPFDVAPLRAITYTLGADGTVAGAALPPFIEALTAALGHAREREREFRHEPLREGDSPLFQLINGYRPPEIEHLRADLLPEQVHREQAIDNEIADIRADVDFADESSVAAAVAALDRVRDGLGALEDVEATPAMLLLAAYRAMSAWERVVALYDAMPEILKRQTIPREQVGMALGRLAVKTGSKAYAERGLRVLATVEAERGGANPETSALIGGIHKRRWLEAREAGDPLANGHLHKAVAAYRRGFEADWTDFYPGINLATLLLAQGDEASQAELARILPIVRYAAERIRVEDYWKHATLLELAVLARDPAAAAIHLADASANICEAFQPTTTADNLATIHATACDPDQLAFVPAIVATLRARGSRDGPTPSPG